MKTLGKRTFGHENKQENKKQAEQEIVIKFDDEAPKKKSNKILTVILGAGFAVCAVTSVIFGTMAFRSHQNNVEVIKDWDDIRSIAAQDIFSGIMADPLRDDISRDDHADKVGVSIDESYESNPMEREINFNALWEVNKQIYCWIYIPGTEIDYPVVQEKEMGNYYYINHDVHGNYKDSGCIITDVYGDTSAHFTILGHNMRNSSMFGTLRYYRTKDFYDKYPYVYLYYPDRVERWSVWSVFSTRDDDMIYDVPYEYDTKNYKDLVKHIADSQRYNTAVDNVTASRQVMTLSTCEDTDGTKRGRFVVNLVKDTQVKREM